MVSVAMPPPPLPGPPQPFVGPQTVQVPVAEARTLLNSFASFLTVSIHSVLYYRNIYPKDTFLSAKAFNLPVHQSRHPKVCSWINDAVDSVMAHIVKGTLDRVAVVIYSPPKSSPVKLPSTQQLPPGIVLERWMFDLSRFPSWPGGIEALKNFHRAEAADDDEPANDEHGSGDEVLPDDGPDPSAATINWTDVDEQLRGAVRRLAYAGEKMDILPEGCSFTVAVELRDDAAAPIGHPQPWIPSQPALQPASQTRPKKGQDIGGATTTPIRAIEAGPLFFECWIEEGCAKEAIHSSARQTPQSST